MHPKREAIQKDKNFETCKSPNSRSQLPGLVCLEIHQGAARKATRANSGGRVGCGGNHAELLLQTSPRRQAARRWRDSDAYGMDDYKKIQHDLEFIAHDRPSTVKTSDQHLLVQRFAPMQNFHALAQPASPERVGLHQLMDAFFGLGLNDPQATFGHLPKLLAQTAGHAHLRLMCSYPINVGLQMGGTQSALIGSIGE
jgi:hypothetical protein